MKINRLTVENFRCFRNKTIELTPNVNVLIGDNGAGKSAVLDALAIGVGAFMLGIDSHNARGIRKDDARREYYVRADIPTLETQYPVRVRSDGLVDGERMAWTRTLNGDGKGISRKTTANVRKTAERLQAQVRDGNDATLPLIAYYGTGRMWYHRPHGLTIGIIAGNIKPADLNDTVTPGSRMDGYEKCLVAESNQLFLNRWIKTYEISILQRQSPNATLDGIKSAVGKCMDRWTKITYDILLDELLAEDEHGDRMPIRLLSDGQRNILYMVLDIAYRASTLNPHFNGDACTKTPGVVLIDELDLHLHPRWQRRIVDDLRNVFPQIQFVASTHAPAVVQSLRAGELIDLNDGDTGEYVGRSTEDILEDVMDITLPQRSLRSQRMIEAAAEYYRVLKGSRSTPQAQLGEIKRRLDELMEPFAENEAYIAFLQQERLAAGVGDKVGA